MDSSGEGKLVLKFLASARFKKSIKKSDIIP
jgi:hypothetical protein